MTFHLTGNRAGFGPGLTPVTRHDEASENTGIGFSVLKLKAGESHRATPAGETAFLLMDGGVKFTAGHACTTEKDARFWWPAEIEPYG